MFNLSTKIFRSTKYYLVLSILLCPCCSSTSLYTRQYSTPAALRPCSCLTSVVLPTPKWPTNIHRMILFVNVPLIRAF